MGGHVWQIWLAAVATLGIYTFLYSDNRLYRFLLNVNIGLVVGYNLVLTWIQVLDPLWWKPMTEGFGALSAGKPGGGGALWVIVGLLGLLWYFQFSRKHLWLSRIVIGMTLGAGAGVTFKGQLLLNAPQITDSFRPIPARADGTALVGGAGALDILPSLVASLNNIIFVGTIICVMVYFFFSFSHEKSTVRNTARIGRWVLMISFGAFFGNSVMTRMAIFLERVQFLVNDWGRNPHVWTPPWIIGAFGFVLALTAIYFLTRQKPKPPAPEVVEETAAPVPEA